MTVGEVISTALVGVGTVATAVAGAFDYSQLFLYGPLGIMCGWFMWRMEGRMKATEAALDRAIHTISLLMIEIPAISSAVKTQQKDIIVQIDEAKRIREGK